ncbi:class II fructose-bisphosphate aldolase [Candidatus Haliotispira prima]|uniref:Fructose-bisphosphate aldolase n=1 Tax=Candidatus Haliotispira prima TaxID=3034016 RepID=A0ABY8MK70_9SPIO|nr:class II fructose-bisphosphate aldolase [Candidatus Haliotispira prima]
MPIKLAPGVITGNALKDLNAVCKEYSCALPAVNVISSEGIGAALAAASEAKAPIIIQFSNGGGSFYAGKGLSNDKHQGAIAGSIAGALSVHHLAKAYGVPVILHTDHAARKLLPWIDGLISYSELHYKQHGMPLFSSHMLDLSEDSLDDNLNTCAEYLERMNKLGMTLEIELGITGGEEDGVDNSGVDHADLYTKAVDVLQAYDKLNSIGNFTVAASFGNTHGVYSPGNVTLKPEILKESQELVAKERGTKVKPLDLVFHGGSGSEQAKITEAVSYGVVKFNIDTDTQWAFTEPVRQYIDEKRDYLMRQIGNPEGAEKPNKKHIDPRTYLANGAKNMTARLVQSFRDLNAYGKFEF